MTKRKKQQKITTLFRRAATKLPEECVELQEEIQQLEQQLREKQNELFQLQRNSYRHKQSPLKKRTETFVAPQKIMLNNSIATLKKDLELMSMLTGTEVQSYVVDDYCCIVFHMQHDTEHELKHGLRIDTKSGVSKVSASSLPLGFNLTAVMDGYDNIMKPESLNAIRNALVAYYNRLEQFQKLKRLLNVEAELFKTLDGSHMEITFYVKTEDDSEDEQFSVKLFLDYRVYDIRPKTYNIKEIDLPEGGAEAIIEQCAIFKKKPLHKAFKDAFVNGIGEYKMIRTVNPTQVVKRQLRKKRSKPNYNRYNDDTFQLEDCTDLSDDDEIDD